METTKICSVVLENVKHALLINPALVNVTCERNYAVLFINEWLDSVQLSTLKHISKRDPIYVTIRELIVNGALIPLISLVTNPVWLNEAFVKLLTNRSTNKNENSNVEKEQIVADNQISVENELKNVCNSPSSPERQQMNNNLLSRIPEGDEICDMKLFTNVAIPKTEEVTTSSEQYVVYCIEFSALFKELHSKEKVKSETENISSTLVRRRITVKRRFREFTTLQSRLESNQNFKDLLKGVKEPSKLKRETQNLLDIAFGKFKLDRKMVEYRRKSLEQYMIFLCSRETIAHSTELQQFLGYGSDSRYAYVKSSQSILLPLRLDKVLTKSVKGAIKFIKVAMPDEPQEGAFAPLNKDFVPRKATTRAVHLTYGESFKLEHSLDEIDNEKLFNVVRDDIIEREDCLTGDSRNSLFHPSALGPRLQGDGCEETGHAESKLLNTCRQLREELPITNNLIDIVTFVLFSETTSNSHLSVMFKLLFGPVFERCTQKLLNKHATKENVIHLIHCLHESIWDSEEPSDKQIEYSPQLVVDTVYSSVSRRLPLESKLSSIYKRVIKKFVDCYQ
ncbi:sorting nexin-19-like protein, partial [Leptotrombidium deliense]